jgi:aspartate 1-decarboxylase
MNGPAAHLIKTGEIVVIMGFELTDALITPQIVLVDNNNNFTHYA